MKTAKQFLIKGLLATALATTAALTASPFIGPAAAAGSPYTCDSGDFCLYYLANYVGPVYSWSGDDGYYADNYFSNGARVNDNTESAWNNGVAVGKEHVSLHSGFNNSGDGVCVPRGRAIPDLGGMKNAASSHQWVNGC
jgi:hypothetical protein